MTIVTIVWNALEPISGYRTNITSGFQSSTDTRTAKRTATATGVTSSSTSDQQEDPQVQKEVQELKTADREVRAHEAAHIAAAGGLAASSAKFTYESGPDGKRYAVAGEVDIDTSPEKDPHQTIVKMQQIQRAALAPADPSPQDRSVAAEAASEEAQARSEISAETMSKSKQKSGTTQQIQSTNPYASSPKSGIVFSAYA